jgi:hypothetical protein
VLCTNQQAMTTMTIATSPTNTRYDVIDKVGDVIGTVTIFGHVGKQYFHNNSFFDYSD